MSQTKRSDLTGLRHEIKLLLSYAEYLDLSRKLKLVTTPDSNGGKNNEYFIRSLYFDDNFNSAYTTKIDGLNDRKKYRIRIYDVSDRVIKFECKIKHRDRIQKTSFSITLEQYNMVMNNDLEFLKEVDHPLAMEVYMLSRTAGFKPSVVVDYTREAYLHPLSNTRLTFDKHLRTGIDTFDIFNKNMNTYPVFPNDSVIFEIKYNEYIPRHIVDIITSCRGVKMSLSKYCMCKDKFLEVKKYEY